MTDQFDPAAATAAAPGAPVAEPTLVLPDGDAKLPGTSDKMSGGPAFKKYLGLYIFAALSIFAIWGAMGGILLPNQVQGIEFKNFFTGADANVNLPDLVDLQAKVKAGTATATPDQQRLLDQLAKFDAARASGLATVTSIGVFLTMLVQPVVGVLSDRTRSPWGRRAPWIAGGAVLGALMLIGLRFSSTIVMMAIFWSLAQILINAAQGPLTASIADRVDDSKLGTASAISGLGLMIGAMLGSVAAGMLMGKMGLDAYFPFAIALAGLCLAFVFGSRDQSSKELDVEPFHLGKFFLSFLIPLRDRDFLWVWIAKIVMMFGYTVSTAFSFFMLQGYIQPALSQARATQIAPLMSLAGLPFMLISMVVMGKWSDRIHKRKPFVFWASIVMAASLVIPMLWPALPALFLQAAIGGAAMGTYLVLDQALFIDVIPDKRTAGRDLGMSALGGNLGQALGPIIAAQVVALSGYRAVWAVAAVTVLIAALAIIPVKRAQ